MTTHPQERDIDQSVLDRRTLATQAATLVLELHEKSLTLVNSKEHAEEWVKCRQDYVSACSTTAALIAAAFEDAIAEISRLRAQPSPREMALEKALRAFGFGKELADEDVGWRGSLDETGHITPFDSDGFHCEFCYQRHLDCTQIKHTDECPVTLSRAALSPAQKGDPA